MLNVFTSLNLQRSKTEHSWGSIQGDNLKTNISQSYNTRGAFRAYRGHKLDVSWTYRGHIMAALWPLQMSQFPEDDKHKKSVLKVSPDLSGMLTKAAVPQFILWQTLGRVRNTRNRDRRIQKREMAQKFQLNFVKKIHIYSSL